MSQHNDGGPAFPVTPTDRGGQIADTEYGMTLRDYFAAKAIAGYLPGKEISNGEVIDRARLAYRVSDAMIAAREVKP